MKASRSRKKVAPRADDTSLIKVRLDERTTITIRRMDALKSWKEKYPGAKVIS